MMTGVQAFLEMGGYGNFVWPCYILSALVLGGIAVGSIRARQRAKAALAAMETGKQDGTESP